jgi:hypothetical protein
MTQPFPGSGMVCRKQFSPATTPESILAGLDLLGELASNLEASHTAVLSHNLASIEQLTREQARLAQALEILWTRNVPPNGGENSAQNSQKSSDSNSEKSTDENSSARLQNLRDRGLAAALRAAQLRVLHLGRVQTALLIGAQRSLTMIANLLAGPQATYGPPGYQPVHRQGPALGLANFRAKEESEKERRPCRV